MKLLLFLFILGCFFLLVESQQPGRCPSRCRETPAGCMCPFIRDAPPPPPPPHPQMTAMRRVRLIPHQGDVQAPQGPQRQQRLLRVPSRARKQSYDGYEAHPIGSVSGYDLSGAPSASPTESPIRSTPVPVNYGQPAAAVRPALPRIIRPEPAIPAPEQLLPRPPAEAVNGENDEDDQRGEVEDISRPQQQQEVQTTAGSAQPAQLPVATQGQGQGAATVPESPVAPSAAGPMEVAPAEDSEEIDTVIGDEGADAEEIPDEEAEPEAPEEEEKHRLALEHGHAKKPKLPKFPQQPLVWVPDPEDPMSPKLGALSTSDAAEGEDRTVIIEVPNGAAPPQHYLPPPDLPAGTVSELPARFNFILGADDTPENPHATAPKNPALLGKGALKPKQSKVYDIVVSDGTGTPSPITTTTTTTEPPLEIAPPFLGDPQLLSAVTGLLTAGALLPALGLADGMPMVGGGAGNTGYPQVPGQGQFGGYGQNGGSAGFTQVSAITKDGFTVAGADGLNHSGVSGFFVPEQFEQTQQQQQRPETKRGTVAEVNPGSFPGSRITSLGEAWGPSINPFGFGHGRVTEKPQTPTWV